MSNSSLVNYTKISPNKTKNRNHKIDSVAIHCMAGNLTVQSCGDVFQNRRASANYGIDSKGRIGLYVDEKDRAWTTSNAGVDNRAVTIEVANTTAKEPFNITNAAYTALINLLVDICKRNAIRRLRWKNDKSYALRAANGGSVSEQNMFVHRWFASKSCPGTYLFTHMGDIANDVNERLASGGDVSENDVVTGIAARHFNPEYAEQHFNPFLLTITRASKNIQWSKLKKKRVVGAVVEGGYLYNARHQVVKKFDNQQLETQCAKLQKYKLPYGMYMYGRARNEAEAKQEMYWFSFPIYRHPPKMGAWIKLELITNKTMNNKIMSIYYHSLVDLGFQSKMGIICTKAMLNKIDWKKWQKYFLLWEIKHVSSTSELLKLEDPKFFDTDGKG